MNTLIKYKIFTPLIALNNIYYFNNIKLNQKAAYAMLSNGFRTIKFDFEKECWL